MKRTNAAATRLLTRAAARLHRRSTAMLAMLLAIVGLFAPSADVAAAPGNPAGNPTITANLHYTGDNAPEETFTVVAKPLGNAPAPTNGSSQPCVLSAHVPNGHVDFSFSFPREGNYWYEISEAAGNTPGITYSSVAYEVQFEVYSAPEGGLGYLMHVVKAGDSLAKPDSLSFENTYTCPDCEPGPNPSPTDCPDCEPSGKPTASPNPSSSSTDCPDCEPGTDPSSASDGTSGNGASGDDANNGGGGIWSGGSSSGSRYGSGTANSGSSWGSMVSNVASAARQALSRTGAAVPVLAFITITGAGSAIYLAATRRRRREEDGIDS